MFDILGHKRNANQNDIEIFTSLQSEWLSSITHITVNSSKDAGKNEYLSTVGMNVN
jgi:hypothetical protein